ncbi:MAG: hypothetical protein ACM3ZT_07835 [Bacillota bacterium]
MFLIYAAILFALGALGGLYMALQAFQGKPLPVPVAVLHGLFGATGLVLLIVGVLAGMGDGLARYALIILVVAALGGFYLLSFHIKKQQHPKAVIVVHALVAVTGFLTLLTAIFQNSSTAAP